MKKKKTNKRKKEKEKNYTVFHGPFCNSQRSAKSNRVAN